MEDVYLSILKKYWGYDGFRGIQREIIESIGNGRDTLGLMPTGGGKSITFQVPALSRDGICIVVTPLIALMKDQVRNLRGRGIKAAAVYSGLSREEILVTLENCIFGNYKFLYVSPERLASDIFLAKVRHMPVSFLTVDEAHCISQWGYDFRPSYTRIAEIRKILPDIPGVCNHSFSLELHEIDHIRNHADKHCHHQIGDYNDRAILDLVLFNSLFFFRDQFFFRC